jgi:uncharacterized protein HemX
MQDESLLEAATPRNVIYAQLENWIRRTFESNDELSRAPKHLRALAAKAVMMTFPMLMETWAAGGVVVSRPARKVRAS